MIKSQFKAFIFLIFAGFVLMILAYSISEISKLVTTIHEKKAVNYRGVIFMSSFIFCALLFMGSQFWRDASFIHINTFEKTIVFQNLFTRKKHLYYFSDFDGFIDMYQSGNGGSYRVVYLVKDRKYIKKISGLYYSNLDTLQDNLAPIKYLGLKTFSYIDSLKILFNKQVD